MIQRAVRVSTMCLLLAPCARGLAAVELTDLGGDQFQAVFRFDAPEGAKTVCLAGTFNGWDPAATSMQRDGDTGVFKATVVLTKGRHEYKFVVNGKDWVTDPDNSQRSPGYQNAIVFAGVQPQEDNRSMHDTANRMPGRKPHPPFVARLAGRFASPPDTTRARMIADFHREHPMPAFKEDTVTFVHFGEKAEPPTVYVAADGMRWGFELEPLAGADRVFALTLDRSAFPSRWAYRYQVTRGEKPTLILDPLAWSATSRSGTPASWGIEASPKRGRIEVVSRFPHSRDDPAQRDLYIYLPPGYDPDATRRYPVLYLHDGQNCWDDPLEPFGHGGWHINLVADELIENGTIQPFIAVGVANTPRRMTEYGPGADIRSDASHGYIQLLERDVKPYIDHTYLTRPEAEHTALMGSSLGGAISLQAALLNPGVFGQAACLSSAFVLRDEANRGYDDLVRAVGKQPVRLYLDSGTAGTGKDGMEATRSMVALLRETGWRDGVDLLHFEDDGAVHNERAWRARVHRPLVFLFGER